MINRLVGDEVFHADRRTGMKQLIHAFRNFASPSKTAGKRCPWNNFCPFWESVVEILPAVFLPIKVQSSDAFNA
jgi:hypothetical protein